MKAIMTPIVALALGSIVPTSFAFAKHQDVEPKIQGSISAKGLQQADFPKAARISAAEAGQLASKETGGSVLSVGLENEDDFLIYAVETTGSMSGRHEVIVDAGNGKILSTAKKTPSSKGKDEEEGEDQDED